MFHFDPTVAILFYLGMCPKPTVYLASIALKLVLL